MGSIHGGGLSAGIYRNKKRRTTFCGKPVCVCVIQRGQHRSSNGNKREEYICS